MNSLPVPKHWKDNDMTIFDKACFGIIPLDNIEHKSDKQNEDGYTIAMILAEKGIIPPKEWLHDPLLKNKYNKTVALILINKHILPPKEW